MAAAFAGGAKKDLRKAAFTGDVPATAAEASRMS